MPVSISGTNGVTFPDNSLQTAAASPFGLKNRIINGAFDIWQRGTSISGSNANSSASYWADRWCFYRSASPSAITLSQQTASPPSGFKNFARIQRTASNTSTEAVYLNQSEEIANSYDLAGQQVTLSFWARAGANYSATSNGLLTNVTTGTGSIDNNSLWNAWTNSTFIVNTTPTLTTSWQKFTYTATVGSSVTQIAVQFTYTPTGTAGANDYFDITGVQLEIGSSATPFERRMYGQELALCQRYYWRIAGSSGGNVRSGNGYVQTTTTTSTLIQFPVTMRTNPTALEQSGTATDYGIGYGAGGATCSAIPTHVSATSKDSALVMFTVASGLTVGQGTQSYMLSNGYLGWSAEL